MNRGRRVVSIVGATGLVGSEIARLLYKRKFPLKELRLFSSGRNPETETTLGGRRYEIGRFAPWDAVESDICFPAWGVVDVVSGATLKA